MFAGTPRLLQAPRWVMFEGNFGPAHAASIYSLLTARSLPIGQVLREASAHGRAARPAMQAMGSLALTGRAISSEENRVAVTV